MATKAAKSITINATKYELANALAVNDGKMQLKAKDVVLDEAELPAGAKYVVFDFGYEGAGFESCKDQDGNDVLTAADVKDIVYDGGDIYIESSERINGVLTKLRWKATTFHDWIAADEVKFEALFPHSISFWHELTAIGTFADNTPTLSAITPPSPSVKITKCKVLAPSGYDKGFLEAMAVNASVTCTVPSGFPKKSTVDDGFTYGDIQGADLVIYDSNNRAAIYAVPLQLVYASGGLEPRYAYFTLYDGKVFRTVLSNEGGTNKWDITRTA